MCTALTKLSVTTSQSQTQVAFQFLKVQQLLPYIRELLLQAAAHRGARLDSIPSELQKTSNLAECESQTLYPPDKGKCFDIAFAILPEPSLRPGRARQQRIALVESNRVNGQSDLLRHDANLHGLSSLL